MVSVRTHWLVSLSVGVFFACSDDPRFDTPDHEVCFERADGVRFCIDVYEAARSDASETDPGTDDVSPPRSLPGLLPWAEVTWAGAKSACESKGKRLCERDEWIDACDGQVGDGGNVYAYGSERDTSLCNTDGTGAEPGGSRPSCKSTKETYDQSGNVREWTGNTMEGAATRGGAWPSTQTHECTSGDRDLFIPLTSESPEVGFRCCRDP